MAAHVLSKILQGAMLRPTRYACTSAIAVNDWLWLAQAAHVLSKILKSTTLRPNRYACTSILREKPTHKRPRTVGNPTNCRKVVVFFVHTGRSSPGARNTTKMWRPNSRRSFAVDDVIILVAQEPGMPPTCLVSTPEPRLAVETPGLGHAICF